MALDSHGNVAGDLDAQAPGLFRRPSDAPARLAPMGRSEAIETLRREVSYQAGPQLRSLRYWAGRFSGRSRRRLLLQLGAATLALADHCDLLADRLSGQAEISEDLAATFGEELARLRAEVLHLKGLTAAVDRRTDA